MSPENWSWKVGFRKDASMLVGLTKRCSTPVTREEGTEIHRLYHCPEWNEVRREIPEAFRRWEQKERSSEEEWKWQRGTVTHPDSENQWNRGHFSMRKWKV